MFQEAKSQTVMRVLLLNTKAHIQLWATGLPLSSGDLTVPSKAMVKSLNGFGLSWYNQVGSDVGIDSITNADLQNTDLKEQNAIKLKPQHF